MLYDYAGRKIETKELTEEVAAPSLMSVRNPWFTSVASGLTPERLAEILVGVDQNDIQDYLTLADEMEERDLHYHSVLSTRRLAVSGLAPTVEAVSDEPGDVERADFVREVLANDAAGFLLADLLDALGKGFSVCEILWDRSGSLWTPAKFEWRDQRFFTFDSDAGQELRLRDEKDAVNGIELAPYKFIQHRPRIKAGLPIRCGLARLAVVAFMCKGFALKDWLTFAEVFGMPLRVGKYKSSATAVQKAALLRAVANIGTDAACIIPDSMIIDFVETSGSAGGEALFRGLADYLDSQLSKGVLGQTMTTDDGSSLAQAQVHDRVRADIMNSDAQQLAATLNRDLVRPLIDLNFGTQEAYPKIRLLAEKPEDLESLAKSLPPFINLGLRVEESVIRDKFGLPEPEDDARVLGAGGAAEVQRPSPDIEVTDVRPMDVVRELPTLTAASVETLAGARRTAEVAVLTAVAAGKPLTAGQLVVLAQRAEDGRDEIDNLVDAGLLEWKQTTAPLLQPLIELAERAGSYEEFIEGLDAAADQVDSFNLVRDLALRMFMARGLGSSRDKP